MRLISTGSVGWWGVMSALLSRHFVRGSDSFLLRLESKTNEQKEEKMNNKRNRITLSKQTLESLKCVSSTPKILFTN